MRRLRLSLGPKQEETLFLALAYAIDTFLSEDEGEIYREENRTLRRFERLREDLRRQRNLQRQR